jgi:hypothetical protein
MKRLPACVLIMFLMKFSYAQEEKTIWNFDGQVQIRSELDGRDFSYKTYPLTFTSLRTRLGLKANISDKINFYAQIQDSRIFGEEPSPTTSIKNLDLYQGYVKLNDLFDLPISIQAGRFVMTYGTERFFGSGSWNYTGRSYDGVILNFGSSIRTSLFAVTIHNGVQYITYASPVNYQYPATRDTSLNLYGVWSTARIDEVNLLDLFAYYEVNRKKSNGQNNDISEGTFGFNHNGTYGGFSSITEAAYQTGEKAGMNVSAYLLSIQASYKISGIKLGAGADFISGTEPLATSKFTTFLIDNTNGHKFYGYMDYFFKTQSRVDYLGLKDFYVTTSYVPEGSDFNFGFNILTIGTSKRSIAGSSDLGREADITIGYNFVKGTTITWGGSVFLPGELMKYYFKTGTDERKDMGYWSYLMITANF